MLMTITAVVNTAVSTSAMGHKLKIFWPFQFRNLCFRFHKRLIDNDFATDLMSTKSLFNESKIRMLLN